jgi:hypothetical protein
MPRCKGAIPGQDQLQPLAAYLFQVTYYRQVPGRLWRVRVAFNERYAFVLGPGLPLMGAQSALSHAQPPKPSCPLEAVVGFVDDHEIAWRTRKLFAHLPGRSLASIQEPLRSLCHALTLRVHGATDVPMRSQGE